MKDMSIKIRVKNPFTGDEIVVEYSVGQAISDGKYVVHSIAPWDSVFRIGRLDSLAESTNAIDGNIAKRGLEAQFFLQFHLTTI